MSPSYVSLICLPHISPSLSLGQHRQTDRQTDRQTETEKQRDRQTESQTDTLRRQSYVSPPLTSPSLSFRQHVQKRQTFQPPLTTVKPHENLFGIRRVSNPPTSIDPGSPQISFLVLIQNAGFVRDNGTNSTKEGHRGRKPVCKKLLGRFLLASLLDNTTIPPSEDSHKYPSYVSPPLMSPS